MQMRGDSAASKWSKTMKELRVLERRGCSITNDMKVCLARLAQLRIPAHQGREEHGSDIIWVDDSDLDRAFTVLHRDGFEVALTAIEHRSRIA
jgi:hypothetical protein